MTDAQRNTGSLWAGLMMIALGVLFLLDRFHVVQFWRTFEDYWPTLLIFLGVVQLLSYRRWRIGPMVLIIVGVILLGDSLDFFRWWNMGTMWPVILIVVGAGILLKRFGRDSWHRGAEAKS